MEQHTQAGKTGSQTHASWDGGAITALFPNKHTTKTRCGKRVSVSRIDDHDIQCGACLDAINRETRALDQLRQYHEVLVSDGLDAANALALTWSRLA
jgi:hypothetical protein